MANKNKIKAHNLFKIIDSQTRLDEIGNIYTAKQLLEQYLDYEINNENTDTKDKYFL